MKYASAYYIPEPVEIYIFIDEPASGLPDNAAPIIENCKDAKEFLAAVQPYYILGSGAK